MSPSDVRLPTTEELAYPALEAFRSLGGSATIAELYQRVVVDSDFSDEQQAVPSPRGSGSYLYYRLGWTRTALKNIGAIEQNGVVNSGVWALTDLGRTITPLQVTEAFRVARAEQHRRRQQTRSSGVGEYLAQDDFESPEEIGGSEDWKSTLLERLLALSPSGFERLAQRLLREAGFANVLVTGRSGDGGIDGIGAFRMSLVSFPVFFQCKRYRGTVTPSAVRDFRGAMAGRGEKGLLVTTGTFTREAVSEATRDGAPAVELIDGDQLCELLKKYRLGVDVRERIVEDVTVDPGFFDSFDS